MRKDAQPMYFDGFFGIILLISGFKGFRTGFARTLITLTSLVISVLFADRANKLLMSQFGDKITQIPEPIKPAVLFFLTLVVMWSVLTFIGSILLTSYRKSLFGENKPSFPDRVLGLALGCAQGCVIVGLLVYLWPAVPQTIRENKAVTALTNDSNGFRLANEYPVVSKIAGLEEVKRVEENAGTIYRFYFPPKTKDKAPGSNEGVVKDAFNQIANDAANKVDRAVKEVEAKLPDLKLPE